MSRLHMLDKDKVPAGQVSWHMAEGRRRARGLRAWEGAIQGAIHLPWASRKRCLGPEA